jgi:hypothetical protein
MYSWERVRVRAILDQEKQAFREKKTLTPALSREYTGEGEMLKYKMVFA